MKYLTLNNNFLKYFFSLSIFVVSVFLFTGSASAQNCELYSGAQNEPTSVTNIVCPLIRTVNILIILGGVVFSFVIVLGAYKYFTSMGDPKGIMGARNTLTYGVAGFLVVIASMAIVVLISNILGVEIGNPVEKLEEAICDVLRQGAITSGGSCFFT